MNLGERKLTVAQPGFLPHVEQKAGIGLYFMASLKNYTSSPLRSWVDILNFIWIRQAWKCIMVCITSIPQKLTCKEYCSLCMFIVVWLKDSDSFPMACDSGLVVHWFRDRERLANYMCYINIIFGKLFPNIS